MTKRKLTTERVPDSPKPPDVERSIRIPLEQWIGIILILTFLVLTVAGVLERRDVSARAEDDGLSVEVRYPERARFRQGVRIDVRVRNNTASVMDSVVIQMPLALLDGSSDLQFLPEPTSAYEVTLTDVAAGDAREVLVEMRPSFYGRRSDELRVRARSRRAAVRLSTFILP